MIQRFYVHNYRSLENFELPVSGLSSALLIGKNGSGKSSVGYALEILQQIGRGINKVDDLLLPRDISHGRAEVPVRLELEVEIEKVRYEYKLAFELPKGAKELRVAEESLTIAGKPKFARSAEGVATNFWDEDDLDLTFPIDRHLVWLPMMAGKETDPVHIFKQWLAHMIILRPLPLLIDGNSTDETLHPNADGINLGGWWSGLLAHAPAAYLKIDASLKLLMPDLKDIKNPVVGKDSRSLVVQFEGQKESSSIPFELLSDGEKCMVLWALTMAANEAYGPLLCFWDEPDNYLALSEIANFATDLRRAFQAGGQFIATSHNAEAIRQFSDDNTFVIFRRNHLEPSQIRSLASIGYTGDLIGALTRGEIEP
ncbi:MAG: ATPase [Verrucomicrobia bacterium 12-59-8]|nr:MAG: ATPase [Verrucomicrobia bacterium 12-59-8]